MPSPCRWTRSAPDSSVNYRRSEDLVLRGRMNSEHSVCTATMGWVAWARRIVAAAASEILGKRTLPTPTSSPWCPTCPPPEPWGRHGAGRRGRRGPRRGAAARRQRSVARSPEPRDPHTRPVRPYLVAEFDGDHGLASPTRQFLVGEGADMSALSKSTSPRSSARWIVAPGGWWRPPRLHRSVHRVHRTGSCPCTRGRARTPRAPGCPACAVTWPLLSWLARRPCPVAVRPSRVLCATVRSRRRPRHAHT